MIAAQPGTYARGDVMSDEALPSMGELLYEYTPMVTRVVEYGAPFEAIVSRQSPPPAEGARVDVYFEGPVTGAKLSGSVKGVDYLKLRADGRFELDIYAEITTEDGKKIALAADGVALGQAPFLQLRQSVKLTSSHPEHAWVNPIQIWASGTVDLEKGEIRVKGYAA
jgi:Protein of unknown function (DUF3237)